ncbi:phage terminase large subunit family protein [Ferrimonas aestuarii]|uniref:Phage terminase large subunit family protein n=1 Tax=Ferrimonas aestuarii TaxID=2569539 RepID=A0A4U1BM42_9GAMM|nr:phage terminase large subunit family protein [Ferrimonas aestuarii]
MEYANASQGRIDAAELMRAPSRISVVDGIQKVMRVPKGAGATDEWDPTLTGYMVEPINCLASREYDAVIFVGPARTGKTIGLVDGAICYVITHNPGDMLLVHLTEAKAREHSRRRLDPTFRLSPLVKECLSPSRHDNNVHDKIFKSGAYLKVGHPSPNSLASSDFKWVFLTDYDRWPLDIGGEGSGFGQASKRTTTYMSAGMTMAESSPGHDVIDPRWRPSPGSHEGPPCDGIMALYNQGDRRRLYWPCPNCGEYFQPIQETLKWPDEPDAVKASEAARVHCAHCDKEVTPKQKRLLNHPDVCAWLREGETIGRAIWRPTDNPDQLQLAQAGERGGTPRKSRFATFWMEGPAAAYQTWEKLAFNLINGELQYEITGSQETLKTTINTDMGRPYINRVSQQQLDAEALAERAEPLPKREVPEWVRFIGAGVDVQGGVNRRFVVQMVGYGAHGERVLIDRYNLRYSPHRTETDKTTGEIKPKRIEPGAYPEDWDILETDVMDKTYPITNRDGWRMPVRFTCCDHGGEAGVSDNAYAFWRKMRRKGRAKQLDLVKGNGSQLKLFVESYPDNTANNRRKAKAKGDVPLYLLGSDELKDRLHAALTRSEPGPNYIHHPDWLGGWFYNELVAEAKGTDGKWREVSSKAPNEAIDCYCYIHVGAVRRGYEKVDWLNPPAWCKPIDDNPNVFHPDERPEFASAEVESTPTQPELAPEVDDDAGDYLAGIDQNGWLS